MQVLCPHHLASIHKHILQTRSFSQIFPSKYQKTGGNSLNHFQPMFHLWKSHVDGFYEQNVWKTPVEEWHFK